MALMNYFQNKEQRLTQLREAVESELKDKSPGDKTRINFIVVDGGAYVGPA